MKTILMLTLLVKPTGCSEKSDIAEIGYEMFILCDNNFIFRNNNLDNMRGWSEKSHICNQYSFDKKRCQNFRTIADLCSTITLTIWDISKCLLSENMVLQCQLHTIFGIK